MNATTTYFRCFESLKTDVKPFVNCTTAHKCEQLFSHFQFSSVQSLSRVWFFATPWTAARQAYLSITNSQSPPKPMSIKLMMPSNHLILCHPLLLLPSVFPSIRVFSSESALRIRWPKYWSFSFSISPSNEHPGLISFRIDWLDLLTVQGTLKSLLQHHSSKASILRHSHFTVIKYFIILQQIELSPTKWMIFREEEETGDFSDFIGCKNVLRVKRDRNKNNNCFLELAWWSSS